MNAEIISRYSQVKDLVRTIFSKDFTVLDQHHKDFRGPPSFSIKNRENLCLQFSFNDDLSELYIHSLNKCGDFRIGRFLLEKMDELATSIKECKVIMLSDKSEISICGCVINLARLEILKTGQSWYNKHGYRQENYPNDFIWNQRFITLPVSDAQKIISDPDIDKEIEYLGDVIPQLKNSSLPLTDYIQILFGYIKSKSYPEDGCDSEQNSFIKIVENVIEAFGGLLRYNESNDYLLKVVPKGLSSSGGSEKRIMRKSRRRTKTRPRKTKTRPRKTKIIKKH
jgi:hypothetical protein